MSTLKDLTQIRDWGSNPVDECELELVNADLASHKEKLDTIFDETAELCSDADFEADHDPDFDTLYESLKKSQIKVMKLVKASDANMPPPSQSFKLDRIKLPQFSGSFNEWQSFQDLFLASVHKNRSLSGVEKMVHLKSCLTGEAGSIIQSFPATEVNYKEAWELVVKRYDNLKEIVFSHIRKFDELKIPQGESATGLRSISDTVNECVRSLKMIKVPVEHWDLILIYYSLKKLDPTTRKEWSLEQVETLPKLKDFITFLEDRARALADASFGSSKQTSSPQEKKKSYSSHHVSEKNSTNSCPKCSESHQLYRCQRFNKLSVDERKKFISQNKLCFNCLYHSHAVPHCKVKSSCKKCGMRHHTLLHFERQQSSSNQESNNSTPPAQIPQNDPQQSPATGESTVNSSHCAAVPTHHVVLMGTLVVMVNNSSGEKTNCRVFMDPGSESHFISEQCVSNLGLSKSNACVPIKGIGGVPGEPASGIVNLRLFSRFQNFHVDINALVLKKITGLIPQVPCNTTWAHLKNIQLSDPFYHQPGPVDILLGAKITASLMLPKIIHGPAGSPVAQKTKFGWMLSGEVKIRSPDSDTLSSHVVANPIQTNLLCIQPANSTPCWSVEDSKFVESSGDDSSLEQFWRLEEPEIEEVHFSAEDEECERHFLSTHTRGQDGVYTVLLPFKRSAPLLGNSRNLAVQRFLSVERRLSRCPSLKEVYVKNMQEYIGSNFMELVPSDDLKKPDSEVYYMPHHVVIKESSTTTKYRICYDASAKTSTSISLNDVLMTGPKLQIDLLPLLIRFRSHLVAMSADIVKFYPQIKVDSNHSDFQRLLWRDDPHLPLQDFRMTRVTFGVKPAPYLAIRSLHQLAEDEKQSHPSVVDTIKQDFLVDNLLSGAHDVESALKLQEEVLQLMDKGNLKLRKWMSNHPAILESVPKEQRESDLPLLIDQNESIRTIGILWQPNTDTFGVSIVVPDLSHASSKRKVLSSIARIFDPLGWLSPVTVKFKILMQELWKVKVDWDTPLPYHLDKLWRKYCEDLKNLEKFRINRCIFRPPSDSCPVVKCELHGFSDASKLAYSACVYTRVLNRSGKCTITLVAAKSKVSPLKTETIPRLELCGAVLLSKLMKTIQDALKIQFDVVRCWTDSTIVLGYLSEKKKLKVFEHNRVLSILPTIPYEKWGHISTEDNPADPASRGIYASELLNHSLWLKGPPWLSTFQFESDPVVMMVTPDEPSPVSNFINNCSSFTKIKHTVAYWSRFLHNCRTKLEVRKEFQSNSIRCTPNFISGDLSVKEISSALNAIIRIIQAEEFPKELAQVSKRLTVKSNMKFLTPFLDSNGILRVGGRLQQSNLSYDQRHPILLPKHHNFTIQVFQILSFDISPRWTPTPPGSSS